MKKSIIFLIIALLFIQCSKEEILNREYPRIFTLSVQNITSSGALFFGEMYSSSSATDHGFIVASSGFPTLENGTVISLGKKENAGKFSKDVKLISGKGYSMRAFAKSGVYVVYGEDISFNIPTK